MANDYYPTRPPGSIYDDLRRGRLGFDRSINPYDEPAAYLGSAFPQYSMEQLPYDPSQPPNYDFLPQQGGPPLDYTPVVPGLPPPGPGEDPNQPIAAERMEGAPWQGQETATPAERLDERSGSPYMEMVRKYIDALGQPGDYPQRRPLSGIEALGVYFSDPQKAQMIMNERDKQYASRVGQYEHQFGRGAKQAELAMGMEGLEYQRTEAEKKEAYSREQVLANAGTYPYPYKNKELEALAYRIYQDKKSMEDYRSAHGAYWARGGGRSGNVKPRTRDEHIDMIRGMMADIGRGRADMMEGLAALEMAGGKEGDPLFKQFAQANEYWQSDYELWHELKRQLDLIMSQTDQQWQDYMSLGGLGRQEYERALRSPGAGGYSPGYGMPPLR